MKIHNDSFDKIVNTYFKAFAKKPFTYKGKTITPPAHVMLSKSFYKADHCVSHCGACCHRFSLDYLPSETEAIKKVKLDERKVDINGKSFSLFSDTQMDHENHHCKYVNKRNGYCKIHLVNPFSCAFELLRVINMVSKDEVRLMNRLYGRGWNMLQYDEKTRGAKCFFTDDFDLKGSTEKLLRLQTWFDYFGIESWVPTIIALIEKGHVGEVSEGAINQYLDFKEEKK